MFDEELRTRIAAGARCVRFEFCFSLLFVTIRRQSDVYLTHSWQERYLRGFRYTLLSFLLGPWGVPWGLIWTAWAFWVNATGGADCTAEILKWVNNPEPVVPTEQSRSQHAEAPPS
ncbi:hypothetical protein [Frigoriglobus tundricola]|uniref:hypothetical protein n=1 Tax=Frigoriglobus tundricola TaxID=2774151 RepID=UPI00148ED408|nr:hypothetical protein [Frigoriglobus tundricola]